MKPYSFLKEYGLPFSTDLKIYGQINRDIEITALERFCTNRGGPQHVSMTR